MQQKEKHKYTALKLDFPMKFQVLQFKAGLQGLDFLK